MKRLFSAVLILCLCLAGCGDVSGGSGDMLTFSSDNGYSVSYPEKYTATSLGAHIDFVLMDDETGTNVTIQHKEKTYSVTSTTKSEFISDMKEEGYDKVEVTTFEKETINGTPCLVAEFFCRESTVTKVFYDASDNTYIATLTVLPGTRTSVLADFTNIIRGLEV